MSDEKEDLKKNALRMLERARVTAKLEKISNESEKDGVIYMPDGSRYEDINDDIADLRFDLRSAGLTLADIGTTEEELGKLSSESFRLNAPHRAKMESRKRDIYDD